MYRGRGVTIHIEVRGSQLDDELHLTPYLAFVLSWLTAATALAVEVSMPWGLIVASIGFLIAGVVLLIRGKGVLGLEPTEPPDDQGATPNRSEDAD